MSTVICDQTDVVGQCTFSMSTVICEQTDVVGQSVHFQCLLSFVIRQMLLVSLYVFNVYCHL